MNRKTTLMRRPLAVLSTGLAVIFLTVAGCDTIGSSDENNSSNVEVGFKTTYTSSGPSSIAPKATGDSLVLAGSNGTLTIDDVRLIVSEIELEGDADSAEFEASHSFLDLPLDTVDVAPVAAGQIPSGAYTEFEFEVEDVDLDEAEEDDDDEEALRSLRNVIHQDYPNWPDDASMVVTGTFTPEGDTTKTFATYFEAEIEVEREMSPAFEVNGDNLSRTLTVKLDPSQWFAHNDGTVRNLAEDDYETTGELVEFEAEFEDGVTEIESDRDDDDDDDDGDDD